MKDKIVNHPMKEENEPQVGEATPSNTIAQITLYYAEGGKGIGVQYDYDIRKFQCPQEMAENLVIKTASRMLELVKRYGLFGWNKKKERFDPL